MPAVAAEDLPAGAFGSPRAILSAAVEKSWTLRQLTDAYIEETLRRACGNRTLAARRLGVSRKALWERERKRRGAEPEVLSQEWLKTFPPAE